MGGHSVWGGGEAAKEGGRKKASNKVYDKSKMRPLGFPQVYLINHPKQQPFVQIDHLLGLF